MIIFCKVHKCFAACTLLYQGSPFFPKLMNLQKIFKGGAVISALKKNLSFFLHQNRGVISNPKKIIATFCIRMNFWKKLQHIFMFFPKKGQGGGKGRSEIFQKFIRFGRDGLPLAWSLKGWSVNTGHTSVWRSMSNFDKYSVSINQTSNHSPSFSSRELFCW